MDNGRRGAGAGTANAELAADKDAADDGAGSVDEIAQIGAGGHPADAAEQQGVVTAQIVVVAGDVVVRVAVFKEQAVGFRVDDVGGVGEAAVAKDGVAADGREVNRAVCGGVAEVKVFEDDVVGAVDREGRKSAAVCGRRPRP